jgi:hypothetical protein
LPGQIKGRARNDGRGSGPEASEDGAGVNNGSIGERGGRGGGIGVVDRRPGVNDEGPA